jgi:hypothetical protein
MNWNTLRERFASPQGRSGAARFRLPSVILEIQPEFVLAAKLDARAGRVRRLGAAEVDALVRWRMKQNLPGAPEEVRLSYQAAPRETGGADVLALAVKPSVVSEYQLVLDGNSAFDLVLPVTAALLPLLPVESSTQLLLNVCCGWMTSVLVCANRVCLWRTREIINDDTAELSRAAGTEVARVVASARDHMQVEITRVWLCARPGPPREVAAEVERVIGHEVKFLEPTSERSSALQQAGRSVFQEFGAPLGGLMANV